MRGGLEDSIYAFPDCETSCCPGMIKIGLSRGTPLQEDHYRVHSYELLYSLHILEKALDTLSVDPSATRKLQGAGSALSSL